MTTLVFAAFIDDFADKSKMLSSKGVGTDKSNPDLFDGDGNRAIHLKENMKDTEIVYKLECVTDIVLVYAYGNAKSTITDGFVVSVPRDNKSWTDVAVQDIAYKPINGASWMKEVAYYGSIDKANTYVRISFPKTGDV